MSLNYSYADVQNHEEFMWDENTYMRPEYESIIWHTMFLGQSSITEDNYRGFYTRYLMYRASMSQGEPFFNLSHVRQMIGLSTNASPKSEAAFKKDCVANLLRKADARLQTELTELGIL